MLRHPWIVVVAWLTTALLVWLLAPDLSRLAAESFGIMLPDDAESTVAARLIRETWPDQSQSSVAVVLLHRPEGLTSKDHEYAEILSKRFDVEARPSGILRVLGPHSPPQVADRLISRDGTSQILVVGLDSDWVAPRSDEQVHWLQVQAKDVSAPEGLEVIWSGDAVLGSEYMKAVHVTLDRASVIIVVLLLCVLLIVYRSLWLALVPLVSIGSSLVIARGILAWLDVLVGWESNPLVELFLIAVLFGTGTDLILLLTWRFAEHWTNGDPVAVMRETLPRVTVAMVISAGTLILALSMLGLARFKLFSQTGPSVALGMLVGLVAAETLAPALLLLLARYRPRSFTGFHVPSTGLWKRIGRLAMVRPKLAWLGALILVGLPALNFLRVETSYDMITDLPPQTPALRGMTLITEKFGPGEVSPLTVVLQSEHDLRDSEGLYLIDSLSRDLSAREAFGEVRSATQPLGDRGELEEAVLSTRLDAIQEGLDQIADGSRVMAENFVEEAAKLRVVLGLERMTDFSMLAPRLPGFARPDSDEPEDTPEATTEENEENEETEEPEEPEELWQQQVRSMLEKLGEAGQGARMIADGARRAFEELNVILENPVGAEALDHLLLTKENLEEYPELQRSFDEFMSPDGWISRIEVGMTARMHSPQALDQADELLERAENFNKDMEHLGYNALLAGPNIVMADVRRVTSSDLQWAYVLLPLGIFLILLILLKDFGICINFVLTMLLTYFFTLSVTDWIFSLMIDSDGLDWKVKFFVFVLIMAIGVDYNIFLIISLREQTQRLGLHEGIQQAIGKTGALITSAAAITATSFGAFMVSPLESLRELGFAMALGITVDALFVRPILFPCGHWLMFHAYETLGTRRPVTTMSQSVEENS